VKRNQRIQSAINRVRTLTNGQGLGGPDKAAINTLNALMERLGPLADTGLATQVAALRAKLAKPRQERILAELQAAKLPFKGLRPLVTARGEHSDLAWLTPLATSLGEYLASATGHKPDSVPVYRLTARILALASRQKRITPELVKARILRARKLK
jgi:hypothetical protein